MASIQPGKLQGGTAHACIGLPYVVVADSESGSLVFCALLRWDKPNVGVLKILWDSDIKWGRKTVLKLLPASILYPVPDYAASLDQRQSSL